LQDPVGGKPVYVSQMSLIGAKGDGAVNASPTNKGQFMDDEEIEPEEAQLVSKAASSCNLIVSLCVYRMRTLRLSTRLLRRWDT